MKNDFWLYFEPYVIITIKSEKAIIYNTLNSKHLEYSDKVILKILKKITKKSNLYVIRVSQYEVENILKKFIAQIKNYFIGDIIEVSISETKPIQTIPFVGFQKIREDNEDIKDLENLNSIILFLNSDIKYEKVNNQLIFCSANQKIHKELDFAIIQKLPSSIEVYSINISGSNIFAYSKFDKLISLFSGKNIQVTFCANYQNLDINTENLSKLKSINAQLNISVSTPLNLEKLQQTKKTIKKVGISHTFDFKIESEQDVEVFENAIEKLNIENYAFHPYYNGNNIELFEQAVYLTKDDIYEAKPTQKDIFARQVINQLNFGKLFILPDGSVYSNLNKPKLGKLKKHSIHELVHKEIYKHKNWFKLRKNVKPCRSCVYNLLCPPISDYEYAIGKYNLCHVWEEN